VLNETRDRQQRLQVPRRGIVPHREERLEVGRRVPAGGVDRARAAQAPPEVVQEPHVLAAQLQVMSPAPLARRGEVVANVGGVLDDVQWVGADSEPAQRDDHRSTLEYWMVGTYPVSFPGVDG
jgi:hypothetical protein